MVNVLEFPDLRSYFHDHVFMKAFTMYNNYTSTGEEEEEIFQKEETDKGRAKAPFLHRVVPNHRRFSSRPISLSATLGGEWGIGVLMSERWRFTEFSLLLYLKIHLPAFKGCCPPR